MKTAWIIPVALVSASALAGCSSRMEKAESRSVTSAQSFRQEIGGMHDRIDKAITALYETTSTTASDRRASYAEFQRQLQWLQNDANSVGNAAERAQSDRETFFREWNREAMRADPGKREAMNTTADMRNTSYSQATSYLEGAKENYRALVSQLNDINSRLGANLNNYATPQMREAVSNAMVKANDLKQYVARLTEQVDRALANVDTR